MTESKHPSQIVSSGIAERYDLANDQPDFTWTTAFGQYGFTSYFKMTSFDKALDIEEKQIITKAILGATREIAEKRGYDKPPALKGADYQRDVKMDLSDSNASQEPSKPVGEGFGTNGA